MNVAKRGHLKCSHHQKRKYELCDMTSVAANTLLVIVLQFIDLSGLPKTLNKPNRMCQLSLNKDGKKGRQGRVRPVSTWNSVTNNEAK